MENVKGILSAKVAGKLIFNSIRKDLQNPFNTTKVLPDQGRKNKLTNVSAFFQHRAGAR